VSRLRVVLADDEPLARQQLRRLLAALPDVEVVAECAAGDETVRTVRALAPDVLFLDVQMPRLDGLGVASALGSGDGASIVFVTAYDDYPVAAIRAGAVDYLVKPVDPTELAEAVARVRARRAAAPPPTPAYLRRLVARVDERTLVLDVADVDWLEARDNYVVVHAARQAYTLRSTLGGLAARLDPAEFARVHRSAVVRLSRVREIQPWFRGEQLLILADGTRVTVGPSYREAFLRRLGGA
jgi:two-component system LytT family response regulator